MAQIPPKAPNMTPNWPDFSHQKWPSMEYSSPNTATTTTTGGHNSSWVDEFLNFSSAKRVNHRRSASDSVAFLEMPLTLEDSCSRRSSMPGSGNTSSEFDRFDDEQLMSMFTDDVPGPTISGSNPSSTSDHNSADEEKLKMQLLKNEPDQEVQSSCENEGQLVQHTTNDNSNDKIFDPKRIKRILANRQSAQRSRVRKLHYISELERSVTSLQAEVSVLSPRVAFFDHQRMVLTVDNGVLKQRIAALAQDKIFKDAHQEALKREIERLRQIYYQQSMKKMENDIEASSESKLQSSAMDTNGPAEKEQLVN